VKHIFNIFPGVLPDYFLLNSANLQNLRESLVKKEKNVYNKQKIQKKFLFIQDLFSTCGIKVSLMAPANHLIFIFIPFNENKSYIFRERP
jgi:hypothetical protein